MMLSFTIVFFTLHLLRGSLSLNVNDCLSYFRPPDYNDIAVSCGAYSIELAVQVCPVVYSGYNETLLVMNNLITDPNCKGKLDMTTNPPVLRFNFSLNESGICGSSYKITSSPGTGIFQDFSNIQSVNISGVIQSTDPNTGVVTYNQQLLYLYSCTYPLEYIINNTRIDVTGATIALKDNNGTFVTTLSLQLFSDANYTTFLEIPPRGINLRSPIYVQVKATNLTSKFNVLLDRCYASVSPYPSSSNAAYYDLFVTCTKQELVNIYVNGKSQYARFSFPAFRFTEQRNLTTSTYYLHCITRLCDTNDCANLQKCNRKRRAAPELTTTLSPALLNEPSTVTSNPITTSAENEMNDAAWSHASAISLGLGIAVGFLSFIFIVMIVITYFLYTTRNQESGLTKIMNN
ncbi:zona pellucida-like domain-containing protein 1 [Erpetoichthys calabaricus]|uniref:zona pellucida-like domain-containing protein 1 n=1 Tax=Erpetoichthys calabaricus TaxID=27687 RepID=UPI002234E0B8|nr:zona pellucida-like domain-containing protein 1 [Erpetoichthys calabaricus]